MVKTREQIDAMSNDERNECHRQEFGLESERLLALLPMLGEFFREHDVRPESGPEDGFTLVSTRPCSPGNVPAWVEVSWDRKRREFVDETC